MRRVTWAVCFLLTLSAGYVVLWFALSSKIDTSIQRWKTSEREAGRAWSCDSEVISGFPFQLSFTCNKSRLESLLGDKLVVTAGSLNLHARIFHPSRVIVGVTGGISLGYPDSIVDLSFNTLEGAIEWMGSSAFSVVAIGENLLLSTSTDNVLRDWNDSRSDNFEVHISDSGAIKATSRILNISAKIHQAQIFERNMFGLNEAPVDIKLIAELTHSGFIGNSPFDKLERWRAAGGTLTILDASVSNDHLKITLNGAFNLDELHRPAGKADVKFNDSITLTNLLHSLSNGTFASRTGSLKLGITQRPVQVPVRLTSGRVFVGPIDTRLKTYPLY
jgi:hypothetical protein